MCDLNASNNRGCVIYMPQAIETSVYFSFDNIFIFKIQFKHLKLLSIHHLICVKLICTGLEMSQSSAAKGSTEEMVAPLNHGLIPILCPSPQ